MLESRPFKMLRKLPYFEKISFVHAYFMRVPNLHAAHKRNLIKIRIFLIRKSMLILKNINSQDVLNGLDSTKWHEILKSNKTPHFSLAIQGV